MKSNAMKLRLQIYKIYIFVRIMQTVMKISQLILPKASRIAADGRVIMTWGGCWCSGRLKCAVNVFLLLSFIAEAGPSCYVLLINIIYPSAWVTLPTGIGALRKGETICCVASRRLPAAHRSPWPRVQEMSRVKGSLDESSPNSHGRTHRGPTKMEK